MTIALQILQLISELIPLAQKVIASQGENHDQVMKEAADSLATYQQSIAELRESIRKDDEAADKLVDSIPTIPG